MNWIEAIPARCALALAALAAGLAGTFAIFGEIAGIATMFLFMIGPIQSPIVVFRPLPFANGRRTELFRQGFDLVAGAAGYSARIMMSASAS